jgi:hypothetical protein
LAGCQIFQLFRIQPLLLTSQNLRYLSHHTTFISHRTVRKWAVFRSKVFDNPDCQKAFRAFIKPGAGLEQGDANGQ